MFCKRRLTVIASGVLSASLLMSCTYVEKGKEWLETQADQVTSYFKSDEELIQSRIDQFLYAFNSGDTEGILECMDQKTRNGLQASVNMANALVGKTGFKLDFSDLFSMGVWQMSEGDVLEISDMIIEITGEDQARVDVTLSYEDKMSEMEDEAFFTMVKEDGDWFIENLESK